MRLETCEHQLTWIPGHVSSSEVGKAVFSLLGAGEHGSYSKINTAHLSGAVWWRGVCANIATLQETLRSVCIFSQSDWSKTQPLMYHFKWTPCPNENTHTYKPHLIEGYRFSHRQIFFSFFFQGEEESPFWNQYSQLVFLQIKAAILRLMSPGTSTERQSGIRTAAVKFYISSKKDWNVILHYLKMTKTGRERRENIYTKREPRCYFCFLTE